MDRPVTATAFAIHEIKRLIVARELPPGEKVDQAELAKRLNLSRLPVRQALTHLAGQSFVRLRDHRSAVVAPISESDIRDLYSLRCQLERWGFEESFGKYEERDLSELNRILDQTEKCIAENDHPSFLAKNREFHFYLYSAIENTYLVEAIKNLFDLSERYHWMCTSAPGMMRSSQGDHMRLVGEIHAGNVKKFLALSEHHNLKTIDWVKKQGLIDFAD